MKEYCNYKKIQGFWITDIPSHWKILKIKKVFKERVEKGFPNKPLLAATQTQGVIEKKQFKQRTVEAFKDLHLLKLALPGDFIISLRSFEGGIEYVWNEGIISPAYIILKMEKDFNRLYFKYLFKSYPFITLLQSCVTGIREGQNINYTKLSEHFIPIPNMEEQDKIVNFLDNKLAKIDRLLSIKQKQTDILKEIILSLFYNSRKNTKNRIPLKKFATLENNFINIDHDKLYQKLGMYNRGRGIFFRDKTLGIDLGQSSFQNVIPNRLIISGQFAWEGAVSITRDIPSNAIASHRYYLLDIMNDMAVPEYIWAYFMSEEGKTVLNSCSHGAAGRNKPLNIREVLEVEIPLPKMDDQEIIKKKILELEKFRTITSHNIQLLQEFRTRLISDAVTGAIDVSNWKSKASD